VLSSSAFSFWLEGNMRERALKVVLVLVGLLFCAGVYPMIGGVLHTEQSDTGDTMMMSLYTTLGVFLLLAVRHPSEHRSLIAFAAWSSFAHAVAMSLLAIPLATDRVGYLIGSAVLVVIGVTLIALAPAKQPGDRTSAKHRMDLQPSAGFGPTCPRPIQLSIQKG
jgi:hypothetical protein